MAHVSRPTQRRQEDPLERVFRRWHVRGGEKRGDRVGKTKRGKGTKLMVLADGQGTPLGVCVEQASPAEVKLLEKTLDNSRVKRRRGHHRRPHQPQRLIADRGYESNRVRALLVKRDIEPIIPKRRNQTIATHQDGRKLRHYRRRWIIERTNSWLQNFRRLVVRYERAVRNFEALVHMACVLITLKKGSG
jgi:transposase